ncbi:cupin domain-containing protein [Streptomyces sp. NPDC095817]|uniref:JmjC domain-containing protein n=1 Tax=Streptomyces sp. NPDC095817 TaxID=3155082 RepID=UPI0033239E88
MVDTFALAQLDNLVNSGILTSDTVRIFYKNKRIPSAKVTWPEGTSRPWLQNRIRPDLVASYVRQGATLAIDDLARLWEPLRTVCRGLSAELNVAVNATAFLTPQKNWGLGYHYDVASVLLLQTHGSKTWRLQPPTLPAPLPSQLCEEHVMQESDVTEFRVTAGQALWIPRGWYHSGVATEEESLHVSFWFPHLTRYWLAQKVVSALDARSDGLLTVREDIMWGKSISNEYMESVVHQIISEMNAYLRHVDVHAVARKASEAIRENWVEESSTAMLNEAVAGGPSTPAPRRPAD